MEIRDSLCDLKPLEIPRPQFQGMQFIATRGKQGFYKTIGENGGKYGVQVKPQRPRRPVLSSDVYLRPSRLKEATGIDTHISQMQPSDDSTKGNVYDNGTTTNPNIELEPDYSPDYLAPDIHARDQYSADQKTTKF